MNSADQMWFVKLSSLSLMDAFVKDAVEIDLNARNIPRLRLHVGLPEVAEMGVLHLTWINERDEDDFCNNRLQCSQDCELLNLL